MARVTFIDNYDSVTWNLVHYLGSLGAQVSVHRNDQISVAEVMAGTPDAIVLSPGPCTPREAGICLDLIHAAGDEIPLFGVCLGHQAIGDAYGGKVVRAPEPSIRARRFSGASTGPSRRRATIRWWWTAPVCQPTSW